MAVPRARWFAAAVFASAFVERIKADGTPARATNSNKPYGVAVAPPAAT